MDWIYHLRRDDDEGYLEGDGARVTIKSGAKLRPKVASIYAGGKATNVARVMDRLLRDDDDVEVELVVFLPDSAEGRYIRELQTTAMSRVRLRPVWVEATARLCVDLSDPSTPPESRVEFNVSPRASWSDSALESALSFAEALASELSAQLPSAEPSHAGLPAERPGNVLLLAGNPPLLESTDKLVTDLHARVIERIRDRIAVVSLDAEDQTLANCLKSAAPPDVIKINRKEYDGITEALWGRFNGTLVVTDRAGCWVSDSNGARVRVGAANIETLYSTIGAGDAVHAAFTLARWGRGVDAFGAARYGQAAAAVAVSAPDGTRGITAQAVEELFIRLQNEQGANP